MDRRRLLQRLAFSESRNLAGITIPPDFSELSQIWGNLCGGSGVSVLPYAHPQLFNVFKHLIYV